MFRFIKKIFSKKKPVVILVGPTASGKSSLGISIAQKYNGEIISCDSRQIYKGLEIFSGATTGEAQGGIVHHMLSFVKPGQTYSADDFVNRARTILDEIHDKKKLPVVVGGTGFWAKSLMYPDNHPPVPPNEYLRAELERLSTEELMDLITQKDPRRAKLMDPHNRRRIVRALEIIHALGTVPLAPAKLDPYYRFIFIYLQPNKEWLDERIVQNVGDRLNQGLIAEAQDVVAGLSKKQCEELGLGYKHVYDLVKNEITREEFGRLVAKQEVGYAKRQKTYFKKIYKEFKGEKIRVEHTDPKVRMRKIRKLITRNS